MAGKGKSYAECGEEPERKQRVKTHYVTNLDPPLLWILRKHVKYNYTCSKISIAFYAFYAKAVWRFHSKQLIFLMHSCKEEKTVLTLALEKVSLIQTYLKV